jgi:DNA replication protein DnaC
MAVHPLLPKLRELRLSGMLESLELRAAQAREGGLTPNEFLALLLDDELERRQGRRLQLRLAEAGWEEGKTLARFDFGVVPGLNRSLVLEWATCAFMGRQENLLIGGPTGIGKSHLAQGLVFEAVKREHRALIRPTHQLLGDLQTGRADGSYKRRMLRACTVDLLVLDDFGLRPVSAQGVDDLYEIVAERYERKSTIITSNRAMEEWPEVFGNELLASAALDRLTHRAQVLVMRGQSYRQRSRRKGVEEPAVTASEKIDISTDLASAASQEERAKEVAART